MSSDLSNDPNLVCYLSLREDPVWLLSHTGKIVGIVGGELVAEGDTLDAVIADLRIRFPEKNRFVHRVGDDDQAEVIEDIFDIEAL